MKSNNRGFTLVELMVAVAMSGIVVAAVYSAYRIQQKTHTAQEYVVEMQQNVRAGMDMMVRDVRMAGFDQTDGKTAGAGIYVAVAQGIAFSADFNEDGDVNDDGENIAYDLYNVTKQKFDGTNTNNVLVSTLGRRSSNATIPVGAPAGGGLFAGHQPIAENIENVEFFYTLDDGTQTLTPTSAQLNQITAVDISILALASERDSKFISTLDYTPASELAKATPDDDLWTGTSQNDGRRRRYFQTQIKIRN